MAMDMPPGCIQIHLNFYSVRGAAYSIAACSDVAYSDVMVVDIFNVADWLNECTSQQIYHQEVQDR